MLHIHQGRSTGGLICRHQHRSTNSASATVYGAASIDTLLPLVVARIEDTTNRIKEGKTGAAFKEIQQYLADVEPLNKKDANVFTMLYLLQNFLRSRMQ
jgi:hypothetical protein